MAKKIELTQKELEKKLGDARLKSYELGRKENYYPANHKKAVQVYNLMTALEAIFDERYELKKEDY